VDAGARQAPCVRFDIEGWKEYPIRREMARLSGCSVSLARLSADL